MSSGESGEDVRFDRGAIEELTAERGTEPGSLWKIVDLWKVSTSHDST